MEVTLQYFDGCPNWRTTKHHLDDLLAEGLDLAVDFERIEDEETAQTRGFRGSPTLLVGGEDLFADLEAPVGLACRIYRTDTGLAGSPTLDQLRRALVTREQGAPSR